MPCCACCDKLCKTLTHKVIAIIGLVFSGSELILAGCYNFTFIGFGLAIIGVITSILYLWMNCKTEGAEDSV